MRVRPLLGPPTKKRREKTYEETTLFVIHYRPIIFALGVTWDVQGLNKSSDGQMPVYLDSNGDGIDVGRRHNCSQCAVHGSNSADSHPSTKDLCHRPNLRIM